MAKRIANLITRANFDETCLIAVDDPTQTWKVTGAQLLSFMKANGTPTGVVLEYGSMTPPTGFVNADGSAISRTTYAALFAVIGTTFGIGDGSTTFNVPDRRNVFARGANTATRVIGGVTYPICTIGVTANDTFQGHYHSKSESGHTHNLWAADNANSSFPNSGQAVAYQGSLGNANDYAMRYSNLGASVGISSSNTSNVAITAPSSDGTNGTPRTGIETKPVSINMNYIIKT